MVPFFSRFFGPRAIEWNIPIELTGVNRWPKDRGDERTCEILKGVPSAKLIKRFPDFDVAYLRTCKPEGEAIEDFRNTDVDVLQAGVRLCRVKSELLSYLGGYYATTGNDAVTSALICIQSLYARTKRSVSPTFRLSFMTLELIGRKFNCSRWVDDWTQEHCGSHCSNLPVSYLEAVNRTVRNTDSYVGLRVPHIVEEGIKLVSKQGLFPI